MHAGGSDMTSSMRKKHPVLQCDDAQLYSIGLLQPLQLSKRKTIYFFLSLFLSHCRYLSIIVDRRQNDGEEASVRLTAAATLLRADGVRRHRQRWARLKFIVHEKNDRLTRCPRSVTVAVTCILQGVAKKIEKKQKRYAETVIRISPI